MALIGLVVELADVVTVAILNLHFFIIIGIFYYDFVRFWKLWIRIAINFGDYFMVMSN